MATLRGTVRILQKLDQFLTDHHRDQVGVVEGVAGGHRIVGGEGTVPGGGLIAGVRGGDPDLLILIAGERSESFRR